MGRALSLVAALLALAAVAVASNEIPWMNPRVDHPTRWGFLDFNRAQGSAGNWDRATSLTGDWGGWRSRLEQGIINPGGTGEIDNALVLALQFGIPF
jgi:carbohydrate-selective porin OprB